MRKFILIIMALVAMNVTDAEAKKFYHYGNTLTFLCDDETMTAEVAGTYHVETSGTITVPETFVAKDGNTYTVPAITVHESEHSQHHHVGEWVVPTSTHTTVHCCQHSRWIIVSTSSEQRCC